MRPALHSNHRAESSSIALILQPCPPLFPRSNIAPSQNVLTVVQHDGKREATFLQWSLIPSWSKDAKGFINARSETIEDKASFSESFHRRRCLIPADGFYEWQRSGKIAQAFSPAIARLKGSRSIWATRDLTRRHASL